MGGYFQANKSKHWPATFFLLMILRSSRSIVNCQTAPLFPAFFIFGDSLVDVGNNNYIASLAKANFYPNGIDFIGGKATGRFCNGKTVLDFIGDSVGLPYPPPYLAPSTNGQNILQGVNYASGAGGILDSSGSLYIQRLGFNQQLKYFQNTIFQLYFLKGFAGAVSLLNKSLYSVVIGSNDYINNYLQTVNSPTKNQYTPQAYQQLLLSTLAMQLTTMYNMGARKIVVSNVGPLGCIPEQISMVQTNTAGTCIQSVNSLVVNFNAGLQTLLTTLNSQLPGAKFVYANVYDAVNNLVNAGGSEGFSTRNAGCCGLGRFNGQFPCLPTSSVCASRPSYVFWDPFHPTEAANRILAAGLFSGGQNLISPVNVQQLAAQ